MYDDNPTLEAIELKSFQNKPLGEERQGEVMEINAEVNRKKFYIESYGCAMNFSDSEIVASILVKEGYGSTKDMQESDLILINTCSIREKAEYNVRQRLRIFEKNKKKGAIVGVLGCMAERLKKKFLEEERLVDMVVGPDAYRDIPNLLSGAEDGHRGVNVYLSREETYADIAPMRLDSNGISGFISIMRGCDNMCSFCVVPFTRGRERSRDAFTIIAEARDMVAQGYKEVTLLGQNVDSYKWDNPESGQTVSFAELLEMTALVSPKLRVRFSTSHPKDITDDVLYAIKKYDNICNYIHLPVQSGSSRILELMNRTYSREWYMNKVNRIKEIIPDCAISSDIITGFCTETEEDHEETLSIIKFSQYSMIYSFYYSERPGTLAAKKYKDDVPLETKKKRLSEVIRVYSDVAYEVNKQDIGESFEVLIEGTSKKSAEEYKGRNSQNKMIIFPKVEGYDPGDYVNVAVTEASRATLRGIIKID